VRAETRIAVPVPLRLLGVGVSSSKLPRHSSALPSPGTEKVGPEPGSSPPPGRQLARNYNEHTSHDAGAPRTPQRVQGARNTSQSRNPGLDAERWRGCEAQRLGYQADTTAVACGLLGGMCTIFCPSGQRWSPLTPRIGAPIKAPLEGWSERGVTIHGRWSRTTGCRAVARGSASPGCRCQSAGAPRRGRLCRRWDCL